MSGRTRTAFDNPRREIPTVCMAPTGPRDPTIHLHLYQGGLAVLAGMEEGAQGTEHTGGTGCTGWEGWREVGGAQ